MVRVYDQLQARPIDSGLFCRESLPPGDRKTTALQLTARAGTDESGANKKGALTVKYGPAGRRCELYELRQSGRRRRVPGAVSGRRAAA